MDFITNTFNNREIALIIYLIIFLNEKHPAANSNSKVMWGEETN